MWYWSYSSMILNFSTSLSLAVSFSPKAVYSREKPRLGGAFGKDVNIFPVLGMEPLFLSCPFRSLKTVQTELPRCSFLKDTSNGFRYYLHRPHVLNRSQYLIQKDRNKKINSYSILSRGLYSIRNMK